MFEFGVGGDCVLVRVVVVELFDAVVCVFCAVVGYVDVLVVVVVWYDDRPVGVVWVGDRVVVEVVVFVFVSWVVWGVYVRLLVVELVGLWWQLVGLDCRIWVEALRVEVGCQLLVF